MIVFLPGPRLEVDSASIPIPYGWDIDLRRNNGEIVMAVFTKGPELHFATFGRKWKMTRKDFRDYLLPLIERFGYVETKTPRDDSRQQRFNELIGFVPLKDDGEFIHYRMENLRHA